MKANNILAGALIALVTLLPICVVVIFSVSDEQHKPCSLEFTRLSPNHMEVTVGSSTLVIQGIQEDDIMAINCNALETD